MRPPSAPRVLALALLVLHASAACGSARAAERVPVATIPAPARQSHRLAYATLVAGVGLIAGSFEFQKRADRAYDRYLLEIDPAEIERLYDRTVQNDRLSSGTLIAGELLLATGLYLRFLRQPARSPVALVLEPSRCALSLRF